MSSQNEQNPLLSEDRQMLVNLLGWVARKLEAKGIDVKQEIFAIYAKLK